MPAGGSIVINGSMVSIRRPGVRRLRRDGGGVAFIRPNMGGGLESA